MDNDIINPEEGGYGVIREKPAGVVNEEAYKQYLKLKANTIDNDDVRLYYPESDNTLVVNLNVSYHTIEHQVSHLSQDEKDAIKRKSAAYKGLKARLGEYRKRAFGVVKTTNTYQKSLASELDIRKGELIEMFGKSMSVQEVHQIVCDDWGMGSVAESTIKRFRKQNYDKIAEKQKKYNEEYSDIRLTNKRSRLDEYSWLYHDRKDKYMQTQQQGDYRLLLQTLKMIKDETELNTLKIEGNITHKIETDINISVQSEIMKGMTINAIIMGRVAHQLGISAHFINQQLLTSAYAKHNGFMEDQGDIRDLEVDYPSDIIYDWDKIAKANETKADSKYHKIEDAEVISDMNFHKESMLKELNKEQDEIQISKSNINEEE